MTPRILAALALLAAPAALLARPAPAPVIDAEGEEAPPPAKEAPPRPPAAPEGPVFELKDGTRVVGKLVQTAFQVTTPYGTLNVPVAELVRVRFGTRSDPELSARIETLVKQLGDGDFNVREKATLELEKVGPPALKALEAAARSGDAEVKDRAGRLIETLSALEEEPVPEDDEVTTTRFTLLGTLQCPSFQVTTQYGALAIEKRHILSLTLQEMRRTVTVKVPGNRVAVRDPLDTKVLVKRGSQVRIKASGSILLRAWGQQSGPDGNPNCGQQLPNIPMGALVGRIGRNGPYFKIGSSFEGPADRDGPLLLAVGVNDNGQQNTGEFKVDITVTEGP